MSYWKCPECGSESGFNATGTQSVTLKFHDKEDPIGWDEHEISYDDVDDMICEKCNHGDAVYMFRNYPEEEEEEEEEL